MKYQFCRIQRIDGELFFELDDMDRATALDYVNTHRSELQPFAVWGSGYIFGYTAEFNDKDVSLKKTTAILYEHSEHGLIWIEACGRENKR